MILSDTWCSSGAFAANGTLVQTGGYNDGDKTIRYFAPCKYSNPNSRKNTNKSLCDWHEESKVQRLKDRRWYASNQILPDNRIIVVGGRRAFSYEFVPKISSHEGFYRLPFLQKTYTPFSENNLYPFLHISSEGNLFIFANKDSILFNYKKNRVVKDFPRMPGGGARNYPSSGSSVMLPLHSTNSFQTVEIIICGGAPENAYNKSKSGNFMNALNNCGSVVITYRNPRWSMEKMSKPRVMPDMLILPNGEILIINGAQKGSAGWELAIDPAYSPFLYRSNETLGGRFSVLAPSTIARLYHSTANILRDGRVLVGGSNPHVGYSFSGEKFPTELRLEAYSPYYLDISYKNLRPVITSVIAQHSSIAYGSNFTVEFLIDCSRAVQDFNNSDENTRIEFNIYAPPFTTHSFSMSQRMLQLGATGRMIKDKTYVATVMAPPTSVAAPPGYYMLFVVNHGIPSIGEWIKFS
jgi:hypothetical protein